MITDLEVVIRDNKIILTPANIKSYTIMTLKGLRYLHLNWILHRDLKPNNLLIGSNGVLKLADFGLAKQFGSPSRIYTHHVVTRWYRAPELLYGSRMYGPGIDVWAVGCIVAELLLRVALFPGETDLDQLSKIFIVTGTPEDRIPGANATEAERRKCWSGVTKLPDYIDFKFMPGTPFHEIFTAAGDDLLNLLSNMLSLDPNRRMSCDELLKQEYFSNLPAPTAPANLPLPSSVTGGGGDTSKYVSKRLGDAPALSAKRLQFD